MTTSSWLSGPQDVVVIASSLALEIAMEAFLVSAGIVAIAEIGDKTQLLALVLAMRFRKPLPILWGILVATLANHALAGIVGSWLAATLGPELMRWILGASFMMMAVWALVPDKYQETEAKQSRLGVFATALIAFFLLEIGDKTQIATVALAARYSALDAVVVGTTAGMMIANVPVVLLGKFAATKLPLRPIRIIAALLFFVMGAVVLFVRPA